MISVTLQSLRSLQLILTFIANEAGAAFVGLLGTLQHCYPTATVTDKNVLSTHQIIEKPS